MSPGEIPSGNISQSSMLVAGLRQTTLILKSYPPFDPRPGAVHGCPLACPVLEFLSHVSDSPADCRSSRHKHPLLPASHCRAKESAANNMQQRFNIPSQNFVVGDNRTMLWRGWTETADIQLGVPSPLHVKAQLIIKYRTHGSQSRCLGASPKQHCELLWGPVHHH